MTLVADHGHSAFSAATRTTYMLLSHYRIMCVPFATISFVLRSIYNIIHSLTFTSPALLSPILLQKQALLVPAEGLCKRGKQDLALLIN